MAKTMRLKPAYDAYDDGRTALSEKKTDEALALANKALGLYSDEAHFHALRGDVRLMNEQYDMAVTNFNRAIARRDSFFYYHLQRGLARHELGQNDGAVADLERSLELLPTAPAHFVLGEIKEERGATGEALEHYKVVAKSGGNYGKAAAEKLYRLELPSQPATYIDSACGDDGSGQVVVQARNNTSMPVTGVQAAFQYVDSGGTQRQRNVAFPGVIAPGKVASARTGIAPYPGTSCAAKVTAAQISE